MHCRVTTTGTTACYVSNFGNVGTNDASTAVAQALAYEASGQTSPQPVATVMMEYDPHPADTLFGVQFWAYNGAGAYIPAATLDSQAGKPLPGICLGCHQGNYNPGAGNVVSGAQFLPFDLDSFLDGAGTTGTPFPTDAGTAFVTSQQSSFHALNNMIGAIAQSANPPLPAITQLIQPPFWYSSAAASTAAADRVARLTRAPPGGSSRSATTAA